MKTPPKRHQQSRQHIEPVGLRVEEGIRAEGPKPRLAFVDHSFHARSKATAFLVELLSDFYDVRVFWDESWTGGPSVSTDQLNGIVPEAIVFFQVFYPVDAVAMLTCSNIVFVPMYDAANGIATRRWLGYRDYRFLNFSSTLAKRHGALGLTSLRAQFFPKPKPVRVGFEALRGFFWQRRHEVTWDQIRRLIGSTRFESVHLHLAVDPPGYPVVMPSTEEIRQFEITTSTWSENGTEYQDHLAKANVFFAPRVAEGIGQSVLEAMSSGMVVVAPDRPTMNEYIVNGETGLLFDPERPEALDFSGADQIGRAAWERCQSGYAQWSSDKRQILDYVRGRYVFDAHGWAPKMRAVARRLLRLAPVALEVHVRSVLNGFRRPYRDIPGRIQRIASGIVGPSRSGND